MSRISSGGSPRARRFRDQAATGVDGLHVLAGMRQLRAGVEGQPHDAQAEAVRVLDEADRRVRVAAELARKVDDRVGVPERDAQQQSHALAGNHELCHLLRVVDHERLDPEVERVPDVGAALDRVRVHAAARRNAGVADQVHFAIRREVEPGPLAREHLNDRPVGQRLQRVVQVDARQGPAERAVLAPQRIAVDDEERRAELGGERLEPSGIIGRRQAQVGFQSVFSITPAEDRRA